MNHSFNVAVAAEYGILEAVLFENISYWVEKNKANDVHFHDGYYWTYNSAKAFSEMFPYVSSRTISRALHHLCDEELLIIGDYNENPYDKTLWYTLTPKGQGIRQDGIGSKTDCQMDRTDCQTDKTNCQMDKTDCQMDRTDCQTDKTNCQTEVSKMTNRSVKNGEPIPDINTNINTDINIPDINTNINTDINADSNLTVSKDTVCRTDIQRVTEQWNLLAVYGIKPVNSIRSGTRRYDMLKARIRSYGIEKILEAVGNIKNSSFLCGGGQKGWTITFEWFVRPNNFIKVLEGNYDDISSFQLGNTRYKPADKNSKVEQFAADARKWADNE